MENFTMQGEASKPPQRNGNSSVQQQHMPQQATSYPFNMFMTNYNGGVMPQAMNYNNQPNVFLSSMMVNQQLHQQQHHHNAFQPMQIQQQPQQVHEQERPLIPTFINANVAPHVKLHRPIQQNPQQQQQLSQMQYMQLQQQQQQQAQQQQQYALQQQQLQNAKLQQQEQKLQQQQVQLQSQTQQQQQQQQVQQPQVQTQQQQQPQVQKQESHENHVETKKPKKDKIPKVKIPKKVPIETRMKDYLDIRGAISKPEFVPDYVKLMEEDKIPIKSKQALLTSLGVTNKNGLEKYVYIVVYLSFKY
jgi:DNA polymerase III alpha subunit (gram-positive type)